MASKPLPNETPTSAVTSPHVVRSSRLRLWALFASGVAVVGAAALATAPAAASAPAPADDPCWQCDYNPNPSVITIAPNFGAWMPNPDVSLTVPAPDNFGWIPGPDVPFTTPSLPWCGQGDGAFPCNPT